MNYRHHYHAGNFADVFKHVLLMQLIEAMKRKEKGFLYLDTHAGRGSYDLSVTSVLPDGRERAPEWPQGIARVWKETTGPVGAYASLVKQFNQERGGGEDEARYYPGSPWVAKKLLRSQDRMTLCELRPDDAEALDFEFARESRVSVQVTDGYTGLRAFLPPPEKRALVLIDPPFETKKEFVDIYRGLQDAIKRLPGAVIAIWYPVTERARTEEFHRALPELATPAFFAEVNIAGPESELKMKGCGLLILNPPWQIDREIRDVLPLLKDRLKVDGGANYACDWLVPDR